MSNNKDQQPPAAPSHKHDLLHNLSTGAVTCLGCDYAASSPVQAAPYADALKAIRSLVSQLQYNAICEVFREHEAVQAAPGAVAWRWHHPEGDCGYWQDRDPAREQSWRDDEGCTIEYAYAAPNPQPVSLEWSEPRKGSEEIRYDHVIAQTPFGRVLITWKSWKEYGDYAIDETPWGDCFGCAHSLDAAKEMVQAEYEARLRAALRPQ